MAAYFDEPDHSGHAGGPFSDLVRTLDIVDHILADFSNMLHARFVSLCVGSLFMH